MARVALVDPEAALTAPPPHIHEGGKHGNISKHVDLTFGGTAMTSR